MSFDVAAEAYDSFMGRWSRLLSGAFAEVAGVEAGMRVLDVGCGTGSLTATLIERVGTAGVAAADPSESFVAAMRSRFPELDVRVAPAESLPFAAGAFDAVLAQLVVHFMTDPVAGLREMARVARPGAPVAACVWDYGGGRSPLNPFWDAVAGLGLPVSDEMTRPGTVDGQLVELAGAAGLTGSRGTALVVSRHFDSFDDWWSPFALGVGPAGAYLKTLDEPARAAIQQACRAGLGNGPFDLESAAWAVVGSAA